VNDVIATERASTAVPASGRLSRKLKWMCIRRTYVLCRVAHVQGWIGRGCCL